MIRTLKTTFRTTKKDLNRLFACNRNSAQVWNDCLKYAKEHHLETGRWINKCELQQLTSGRYNLHSQSIQTPHRHALSVTGKRKFPAGHSGVAKEGGGGSPTGD